MLLWSVPRSMTACNSGGGAGKPLSIIEFNLMIHLFMNDRICMLNLATVMLRPIIPLQPT